MAAIPHMKLNVQKADFIKAGLISAAGGLLANQHGVSHDEGVHAGAEETRHGLTGRIDDRLVFIEAGVEKHGNAGDFFEFADQPPVQRVLGRILPFAAGLYRRRA